MASPGMLFLMLMSSTLLLSSLSDPLISNHKDKRSLQKRETIEERARKALEYLEKIEFAVTPFIGLIPVVGPPLKAITQVVSESARKSPNAEILKQFEKLNLKLDHEFKEIKWNQLAKECLKHVTNIKLAWKRLNDLKIQQGTQPDQETELFKKQHICDLSAIEKLHDLLTRETNVLSKGFDKQLSQHFNCHEKDIKAFTVLINSAFFMGNIVNYFFYDLMQLDKTKKQVEYAYEAAKTMYEIHKFCLSHTDDFLEEDIQKCLEGNDASENVAKDVRLCLEQFYKRYNWLVIVKKKSHRKIKTLTKQSFETKRLSEAFTQKDFVDFAVAVARQIKGQHTKADTVREAIDKCFAGKRVKCDKVIEELTGCKEKVNGEELQKTYSVVHSYTKHNKESVNAKDAKQAPKEEEEEEEEVEESLSTENDSKTPYIYTGECVKTLGKGEFRVLIKSDEEITQKSPCYNFDCGTNGKCEVLKNTFIPVCECDPNYFGEKCSENTDEYKRNLKESMSN